MDRFFRLPSIHSKLLKNLEEFHTRYLSKDFNIISSYPMGISKKPRRLPYRDEYIIPYH
jgi:hypothetical protein